MRGREYLIKRSINVQNALALARVALAGPRREQEEEAGVLAREHLAPLVRVEHGEQARAALEGIAVVPEIVLDPHFEHDDCKADAQWRNRWAGVFQRLHWTDPQQPPAISLKHFFSCVYAYGPPPRYFVLSDSISLEEANVVFQLNGRLVRKWVNLVTAHHEQFALEDDLASRLDDFLPRNIQDFLTDLVLGNSSDVPPIPAGSNASAARGR